MTEERRVAKVAPALAPSVHWVQLGNGRMAIGHRPKLKSLSGLRSAGCTHVVTLLSEREGASAIGAAAQHAGLIWRWLPLDNGDPPPPERDAELRNVLTELNAELDGGAALYLHCSAGIHRTGMIANALLRLRGLSSEQAQSALHELRSVTGQGVGQQRLQWGERIASSATA